MRRAVPLITLALTLAAWRAPAAGASLALTEREKEEALRMGQRSVTTDSFGGEWRVPMGSGESVSVITPFHRLAWAARNAAFKSEPLKPQEQERIIQEFKERLRFDVDLHGPRQDFARFYVPRLLVGEREIEPSIVQNERTAARQGNGAYLARCVYWFPSKDITGQSQLVLVVRDPDGQQIARFPIDLAAMR